MQLKYAFVIVPLFVAVPTFAQHLRFLPACFETAKTQTAITECAGDEAKSVEAQMAGRYRELIDAAASVEGAVAKIAADQRAWVATVIRLSARCIRLRTNRQSTVRSTPLL